MQQATGGESAGALQHSATHCHALSHTAIHFNRHTLQHTATHCHSLQRLMQQIVNPRVPDADKNALLALMSAEADALASELGIDVGA